MLNGVGINASGTYSGHVDVSYTYTPAVVVTPPTIAVAPAPVSISVGGLASFTVSANGSAPFTYQWLKNGTSISGATSATLSLSNVDLTTAGLFSVTVTNSAGSVTSLPALLTVSPAPTAPSIGTQPSAQSAAVGGSVTFTVGVQGSGPFTYQWRKDGVAILGAVSVSFTIPSVQSSDAGTYSVVVTSLGGSTTSAGAALIVNSSGGGTVATAPAISSQPAGITLSSGGTLSLSVTSAGTAPFSFQWYKNGALISGANSATYSVSNASVSDSGTYYVAVSNSVGSVNSANAVVVVLAPPAAATPPTIGSQPASQIVTAGDSVTFSVSVTGSAPFAFQWMKNGTAIAGATSGSMTIASVQLTDAGNYSVRVTNTAGSSVSASASLTVNSAPSVATLPSIGSQPATQTANVGDSVAFSVSVSGSAPFSYQWLKNGAPISGATSSNLVLSNVQTSSTGAYSVVISNAVGSVTSGAAQLTVKASAGGDGGGTTAGLPSINVTPTSQTVTVGSTVTFLGGATGTGVSYQWLKNGAAIQGATNSSLILVNVQPSNAGDYAILAQNSVGSVVSSSAALVVQGAATVPEKPAGHLVNLSTRSQVGTGSNILIGGFVISGTESQTLLIRGVGPTLSEFGLKGVLANPELKLYRGSEVILENADWTISDTKQLVTQMGTAAGAFALETNSKDAAAVVTLKPGAYTVAVDGENGDTGIGMIELYNVSTKQTTALGDDIVNLSSRGYVGKGDQVVIAGFVVGGDSPKTMLVRGIGPSLGRFGVPNPLSNPKLQIYRGDKVIKENTDWSVGNDPIAVRRVSLAAGAFALDEKSADAATLITLDPGTYTGVVSSEDGSEGVAMVEIYQIP